MPHKRTRSSIAVQLYFDTTIHNEKIKDTISGKNEQKVKEIIEMLGYEFGKDFKRQYPIGNSMVVDFAFPHIQFAIEVDGNSHMTKTQKELDKKRDSYLRRHNWVILRIPERKFFSGKQSFYKYLIQEIVQERLKEYDSGKLNTRDYEEGYR